MKSEEAGVTQESVSRTPPKTPSERGSAARAGLARAGSARSGLGDSVIRHPGLWTVGVPVIQRSAKRGRQGIPVTISPSIDFCGHFS